MFELLRKLIVPIMLTVLVAFIATIIFSWGGGGFRDRPKDTVGIIDGTEISIKTFDSYYSNLIRQEQQKSDYDISSEKRDEIRRNAWTQLQADFLINREIEKNDITVSPDEIYTFLKMYPPQEVQAAPQFQTDGKFDHQKYINAMVNPENAPFWSSLEQYIIPDLKKYKLQEKVISTVRITPAEILQTFLNEKEKIKIGYIKIDKFAFASEVPEITDEEVLEYYEAHKEDYKLGERAEIDYVKFEKAPSENDWQRAKYEIDDIYDTVMAGGDFADLARVFSQDASAESGGDLGWFKQGRMVPEFDSAVFAMKVDEVSPPIKTRFGYHIIKLLGIKDEERNAAHILIKAEASGETLDQLYRNAQDFANLAREQGFESTAEEYNYEILSSKTPFDKNGLINEELSGNQKIIDFAFANKEGAVSEEVFEDRRGFYVVKVKSRLPESYSPIEDARKIIVSNLKTAKTEQMAVDTARVVHQAIAGGMSMSRAAGKFGFNYNATDFISRSSVIQGVGRDEKIMGAAFALGKVNDISEPVPYRNGVVIMRLLEKQDVNLEEFNQVRDSLETVTLQRKQQDMYRRWYENLISEAKIVSYLDEFYRNY